MFGQLAPYAGDPILGLIDKFAADRRATKVNLGVGIYYDESGRIPVLGSIRAAALRVFSANQPTSYLPIEGNAEYCAHVGRLLFGERFEALCGSLATVQSIGGSGAIKVGADFLKRHFPDSVVHVSDPTWENHIGLFEGAGFEVRRYRYYDAATKGLDLEGMLADLNSLNTRDIVLLHPCCHNPTGVDPTAAQWLRILDAIEARNLIAFVDTAYQGLGESLEHDTFVVTELARRRQNFLVSHSFSKIFSLYGERCGALIVHCADREQTGNVLGQLKLTVRRSYSSPPTHGMRLISAVLGDENLRNQWVGELAAMRERIVSMRRQLFSALQKAAPDQHYAHIVAQRGMFAYTGFDAAQVARLQADFGVYAVSTGRICIAGLNASNLDHVADAFARVA